MAGAGPAAWAAVLRVAQIERPQQADPELGEQQGGAGLEGTGGGLMQDAQQHEGDQRDIDLDLDGVFAAPPGAADFEVLLEPFEQQLDLPALFVEPGDLGGRALQIVGQPQTGRPSAVHLDSPPNPGQLWGKAGTTIFYSPCSLCLCGGAFVPSNP